MSLVPAGVSTPCAVHSSSIPRSPSFTALRATPGSSEVATLHPVDPTDPAPVAGLARRLRVDLGRVGPEAPLVAGVADAVREAGIACFGPSGAGGA